MKRFMHALPIGAAQGQSMVEVLLMTLAIFLGVWGVGWVDGRGGVLAMLLEALRLWHARFAAALALPM